MISMKYKFEDLLRIVSRFRAFRHWGARQSHFE
jgi:hypothetical protein